MWTFFAFVLLVFLSVFITLAVYGVCRHRRNQAIFFVGLCCVAVLYLLGWVAEIAATSPETGILAVRLQVASEVLFPPLFLFFVRGLCGAPTKGWVPALVMELFLFLFVVVFLGWDKGLFLSSMEPADGGLHRVAVAYGTMGLLFRYAAFFVALYLVGYLVRSVKLTQVAGIGGPVWFTTMGGFLYLASTLLAVLFHGAWHADSAGVGAMLWLLAIGGLTIRYRLLDDLSTDFAVDAVEAMEEAVIGLDRRWCYGFSNPMANCLFPDLGSLYLGESLYRVENWPIELAAFSGLMEIDFSMVLRGERRFFRTSIKDLQRDGDWQGWCLCIRDISEMARMMAQLKELAVTDFLTGVYNRRHFVEAVSRERVLAGRQGLPTSLMLFDLDQFKDINDTHGHQIGDRMLRMTVETVRRVLRPCDIFARYGGDEFVLFAVGMTGKDAEHYAWQFCQAIRQMELPLDRGCLRITASFGVVELPEGISLEQGIQAADKAMYMAKQEGQNRVVVGCAWKEEGM